MEKIPLVKKKENYIISGFLLEFLQLLQVGGGAFYIQSIFINLISVYISKKDVLQRV